MTKRDLVRKPMRIQARKGSDAERYYDQDSPRPPRPSALAPGLSPAPEEDLLFHGGNTVPQMLFQNVFLGGNGVWEASDITSIDDGSRRAMRFAPLNNVLAQYFDGKRPECEALDSIVVPAPGLTLLDEPGVQAHVIALYNESKIKHASLDSTIFNLILPPGTVLKLDNLTSLGGLGGYHGSVRFQAADGQQVRLYYSANVFSQSTLSGQNGIVAFDQPWKNVVGTLYHEMNEFRTDPDISDAILKRSQGDSAWPSLLGWAASSGNEIGDQPIAAASSLSQVFREIDALDGRARLSVQFLYSNDAHGAEGPLPEPLAKGSTGVGSAAVAARSARSGQRPHGVRTRGADLSRSSLLFGGPFGRMFRAVPAADFGVTDQASEIALAALAAKMTATSDPPKDGPDAEESGLPSAYTYFGQFIDHDLTFDPASSLQRQNDPDALVDFRTPRFDLDNVYGRGPDDNPYLYEDGRSFILGRALTGASQNVRARDLPRSTPLTAGASRRAIIGDPRNDENVIVSQLQGLFHRFHNRVASLNPTWDFARIQREVRFHYQWVVLNDFLPAIVSHRVLRSVVPHLHKGTNVALDRPSLDFYHPREDAFMPLEFSAAAYRFGHSMVRPGYRLSESIGPLAIFETNPLRALTGFREFPNSWAIDWSLFIDLEPRDAEDATRTQLAYRIDTSLVNPLGNLPPSIATNPNVLAERNLLRGWRMRLPSGQAIARAMGLEPLKDENILLGKFTGDPADILGPVVNVAAAFADNCPLWTYVLAETEKAEVELQTKTGKKLLETRRLGPVGGRIVAETFVGILLKDSSSFVAQDPRWVPSLALNGKFGLRDLVRIALEG